MSSGFNRFSTATPGPRTLSVLTMAILLAATPVAPAVAAQPAGGSQAMGTYTFAIGQQSLVSAINGFTHVTGWQVGLSAELGQDVQSPGVHGALTPDQALERLLVGTNLSVHKLADTNVVLERRKSDAIALQQVTVSATRNAQDVNSVPATVTVQDRETLDRNNVNTIKELVRYEPGVSVGGTGQRAGISGFNIRGIDGNRILTQVDGVEVPASFFNGPYAQTNRNYVDPEIVKRVEILRGPASSLYGSSAIGGAVSYYTLDPDDIIKPGQDVGARLKTGYSSADRSWLKSGTVAGRQGDVDALLHLSQREGHETASYGEHGGTGLGRTAANPEDARTTNILAKLGWDYGDDARLGLTYERYKDDRDTNLKSAVGGPFINGAGFGMYKARSGNTTTSRERFGIENSFGLDSYLADHVKMSLNYQLAKTDESTREIYAPSRVVYRTRDTQYKERTWIFDAQLDKSFAIADTDHRLTYGTTLKQQKVTGLRTGQGICMTVGSSCSAVGAVSTNSSDTLTPASDFPDPTVNTYSLFAQDEIKWDQWTFLPSVRYDYTQMKPHVTQAFLNTVAQSGDNIGTDEKRWHKATPRLGVTYAFNDSYTWYGQYAEGYRTPTAKALYGRFTNISEGYIVEPNPNLKPESSQSLETGLRGQFQHGNFDLAVFYNKYHDFIDENALTPGYDETAFKSVNIKHATIKGAEVKGRLSLDYFGLPTGLYTQGSVAYTYGRNNDNGQPLNTVNPLKGVFGLGYDQDHYGGLLSWTLVKKQNRVDSSSFHTPDGTSSAFKTPGFGVFDLTGYYKVTRDVTVSAGLYNLTDKKYWLWDDVRGYDSVGEAAVTQPANLDRLTQPGRNFAVNLVWDI